MTYKPMTYVSIGKFGLALQVARKRLREIEKGKAKLIDAEDVWKDLGICVYKQNCGRERAKHVL